MQVIFTYYISNFGTFLDPHICVSKGSSLPRWSQSFYEVELILFKYISISKWELLMFLKWKTMEISSKPFFMKIRMQLQNGLIVLEFPKDWCQKLEHAWYKPDWPTKSEVSYFLNGIPVKNSHLQDSDQRSWKTSSYSK